MPALDGSSSFKFDAPLREYLDGREDLTDTRIIPVIVRCRVDHIPELTALVAELNGKVRHKLASIGGVAALLPLRGVVEIAGHHAVQGIELEQSFSVMT